MSISKQLMTMLAIALLGIVAVFSIGINKMEKVYEETNTCNVNSLPSVLAIGDLQQGMYRIRLAVLQHLGSENIKDKKNLEEKYYGYKAEFLKNLKRYEVLIADSKNKEFFDKEKEYFSKYTIIVEKLFQLSNEDKRDEIKKLIAETSAVPQTLTKTTDDHMDYNQLLAENDAKSAVVEKSNASTLMIGLSLLIAISVIILGIMIRNNIMNGVFIIRDGISGFVQNKELKFRIKYGKTMRFKRLSIVLIV